jgi:RNAse (barnase) inhibitor barstar
MSKHSAKSIDDFPSHSVRMLESADSAVLRNLARDAGQVFTDIDLSACVDKDAVLTEIGRALGFPAWFGANLDALYDCLTDMPDKDAAPGWVIVLRGWPRPDRLDEETRDALLDVFRDATDAFSDQGRALRVFYEG